MNLTGVGWLLDAQQSHPHEAVGRDRTEVREPVVVRTDARMAQLGVGDVRDGSTAAEPGQRPGVENLGGNAVARHVVVSRDRIERAAHHLVASDEEVPLRERLSVNPLAGRVHPEGQRRRRQTFGDPRVAALVVGPQAGSALPQRRRQPGLEEVGRLVDVRIG